MASAIKRRGLLRTVAETMIVVVLALLAMANPGSTKSGGGPPYSGGFSSASWNGSTAFDDDQYQYAIIDASTGVISDLCEFLTAVDPDFAGAAQAVHDAPGYHPVHAFWFLTSSYMATNTCGFNLTPYQWGQQQANWFLFWVGISGYTGTVSQMFGDVEHVPDASACGGDLAGWECDTPDNNRKVIKGFEDALTAGHYNATYNGFYSSVGEWSQIADGGDASSVGTKNVWMASMCASQQQLDDQAQYFRELDYYIFSWQYTINDNSIPGCDTCALTYSDAESQAKNSSVYIHRWDVWTNSSPDIVC